MAETEFLELEKTIQVDGQTYNINAKTAEQADSVVNKLIFKKTNLSSGEPSGNKADWTEFDGSEEKILNIVPATGGGFSGGITVPAHDGTVRKESVLNYQDIKDIVVPKLINTSVLYNWNGAGLNPTLDENDKKISSISVVAGAEALVDEFASYNNSYSILPAYLYICDDTGNLYFGKSNSTEALKVASTIGKDIIPQSIYIGSTHQIIPTPSSPIEGAIYNSSGIDLHNSDLTNINSMWFADSINTKSEGIIFLRNSQGLDAFTLPGLAEVDGTKEKVVGDRFFALDGHLYFNPGIVYYDPEIGNYNEVNSTGENTDDKKPRHEVFHSGVTIPVENGGTGASTAAEARKNIEAAKVDHTHFYAESSIPGGDAKRAESAKKADEATKATNDSSGHKIVDYYQPKILTGTADPKTSTNSAVKNAPVGAIYIKYSTT